MRARGTRGGILLSLDSGDTLENLPDTLNDHQHLLENNIVIEIGDAVSWPVIDLIVQKVASVGGTVLEVRPPPILSQARGETVIVAKTIRSGGRVESSGSVVVLGDVNAGAEIIANDDVIVVGILRGVAHAGANGNENAVIWARQILSPQLRIGDALAQASGIDKTSGGPEVAHLQDGQIVLRPW
ncbi:MAG: septum site-determining protein MinC [Trueperaceae bacterium]|nr:MAG: septum site-determining protein MinC [Trueperaceae bacterium]